MQEFKERVAVVTGGAAGIGRAIATALFDRGAHVVLADIDDAALAASVAGFEARGARVRGVHTDVRDRASVEALAETAFREFGSAHILCNNAGIAPFGASVGADTRDWEATMDINFWGVLHGIDAFVPRMRQQGDACHIVNTASMAGLTGMLGLGMYCASKFAVVGLTESLERELRDTKIGVSVLCPMMVDTEIGSHSRRMLEVAMPDPQAVEAAAPNLMQGNVISAQTVAARVLRAIERGDLYIFTHPEQREILRRRAARQDAMFDAENWSA